MYKAEKVLNENSLTKGSHWVEEATNLPYKANKNVLSDYHVSQIVFDAYGSFVRR